MTKYQEKNFDNDFNIRTVEQVLFDFISALDEAIATYNILEKIKEKDTRPNQLLFCHIVNNFDSFISSLSYTILLSNKTKLKEYCTKNINLEEKTTFKEVIAIQEIGLDQWMKNKSITFLEQDLNRKRHSQKLDLLLSYIDIEYKKIYVYLTGPGKTATGCLKTKPTPENKKGVNHKTTSEELLGYADILYEKRNAITHNNNFYPEKTIARLNQEWGLKINRSNVLVRQTTIKGVLRFYTSLCLKLLSCTIVNNEIQDNDKLKKQLEDLREFKNIINSISPDDDSRFKSGGIKGRKEKLIKANPKNFNYLKYQEITGVAPVTVHRDLKQLLNEKFIISKKRGIYNLNI